MGVSVNWRTILSDPLESVVFSLNTVAVATPNGGGVTAELGLGVSAGLNNSLPNTMFQNLINGSPTLADVEQINHTEVDITGEFGGSFDSTTGGFTFGKSIYGDVGASAGGMVNQPGASKTWSISLQDLVNAFPYYY